MLPHPDPSSCCQNCTSWLNSRHIKAFDQDQNFYDSEDDREIVEKISSHLYGSVYRFKKQVSSFRRFVHFIREEKPYFDESLMNLEHLESVICVKTKQDNPHIIRQNGAFFLFGVKQGSENKLECATIPDEFHAKLDGKNIVCIIPAKKKKDILKELESLSISEGHLFTDIDKVAKDIKKKFMSKAADAE